MSLVFTCHFHTLMSCLVLSQDGFPMSKSLSSGYFMGLFRPEFLYFLARTLLINKNGIDLLWLEYFPAFETLFTFCFFDSNI